MGKKGKIVMVLLALAVTLGVAGAIYIKYAAPPGEEWISYRREEVIAGIDKQLLGIDMEKVIREKEAYVVEKSIQELQQEVRQGLLTYEEITAVCLYRIKTLDQAEKGYNSVITVNPEAMAEARKKDSEYKAQGENLPPLYGIPVMLKDNINTADMAVSAGTEAFSDFYPGEDAVLVKALKDHGAIILGKNNLSELAGYFSSVMPAGYSGRKGQTVNPFGPLKISAFGSSSGSAVAVTANLVPISIGTETDGSIIAPAAANSVVGFKPSRRAELSEGIFPLIKKLDTAGPISKSVKDAAAVYQSMIRTEYSTGQPASAELSQELTEELSENALEGKKIGIVSYDYEDQRVLGRLRDELNCIGADTVDVEIPRTEVTVFQNIPLSLETDYEAYAKTYRLPIGTLAGLVQYNRQDAGRRMKYGQDLLEEAAQTGNPDPDAIEESIQKAEEMLTDLFDGYRLDALVFLNSSGTTTPAAAGYPELTVPFGTDKNKVPQGVTFVARFGEDEKLLNLGYSFESHVQGRLVP